LLPCANSRKDEHATTFNRFLRRAPTIADLKGAEDLDPKHLAEAVQYRTLDSNLRL
jgi:magnesium chelatase family protein